MLKRYRWRITTAAALLLAGVAAVVLAPTRDPLHQDAVAVVQQVGVRPGTHVGPPWAVQYGLGAPRVLPTAEIAP